VAADPPFQITQGAVVAGLAAWNRELSVGHRHAIKEVNPLVSYAELLLKPFRKDVLFRPALVIKLRGAKEAPVWTEVVGLERIKEAQAQLSSAPAPASSTRRAAVGRERSQTCWRR
jgi:hypothetical protein